jgi:DNA-binding MarR family transcriptional regulator
MSELEDDVSRFIAHVDALADRLTPKRRRRDAGAPECSPRELRALRALGRHGTLTMTVLSKALDVPLSTATRIVEGLCTKGLVERRQSKQDRRVVEVRFGQRGKRINRYVEESRRSEAEALLLSLSERERSRLVRQLARLLATAETG